MCVDLGQIYYLEGGRMGGMLTIIHPNSIGFYCFCPALEGVNSFQIDASFSRALMLTATFLLTAAVVRSSFLFSYPQAPFAHGFQITNCLYERHYFK